MVDTNQPQQEHTDIPGIDPIFLNQRICVIHQSPLINRNAILWLLILLDKSHGLQYLIEHDIVNLVVNGQVNLQPLKHSKILPDKPLSGVFFIRIINCLLGSSHIRLLLCLHHILALFLPSQRVPVQQLIYRCLSCHFFALLWYIRMERVFYVKLFNVLWDVLLVL